MKKKSEIAASFYNRQLVNMSCPVCNALFDKHKELLTCLNGHHFTLAKQGYFHFVNHKVQSEYTKTMLINRRKVIQSGLYQPVIEYIQKLLPDTLGLLVDAGTGEGSFLHCLETPMLKWGIDLSKEGILLATDYNTHKQGFAVADLTKMPLQDRSADIILNFLSPAMYQEFKRILKKDGQIIKVIPGSKYLQELRHLFYLGTEKENYDNTNIVKRFATELEIKSKKEFTYQVLLSDEIKANILQMSPLTWNIEPTKEQQQKLKYLTIDLVVLIGQYK